MGSIYVLGELFTNVFFYTKLLLMVFAPQYLCDLLEPSYQKSHQNNLKNNSKFILTQIKTTSYMERFLSSTTKHWNDLPYFIKNITYFIIIRKEFERHQMICTIWST